jgi:hypothetical protein
VIKAVLENHFEIYKSLLGTVDSGGAGSGSLSAAQTAAIISCEEWRRGGGDEWGEWGKF